MQTYTMHLFCRSPLHRLSRSVSKIGLASASLRGTTDAMLSAIGRAYCTPHGSSGLPPNQFGSHPVALRARSAPAVSECAADHRRTPPVTQRSPLQRTAAHALPAGRCARRLRAQQAAEVEAPHRWCRSGSQSPTPGIGANVILCMRGFTHNLPHLDQLRDRCGRRCGWRHCHRIDQRYGRHRQRRLRRE